MRLAAMAAGMAAVVLGGAARAEEAAPAPPPEWSVGAGVGLVFVSGLGSVGTGVVPTVSFERLFGEHFSLGLGLGATYQSQASESFGSQVLTGPLAGIAVTLEPRWTVTAPTAPVAVSLYLSAEAGYTTMSHVTPGVQTQESHAFNYLFAGGMAVERRLLDRLALRLGVQLVRLIISRSFYKADSDPGVPLSPVSLGIEGVTVGVTPSPSLELRLYF